MLYAFIPIMSLTEGDLIEIRSLFFSYDLNGDRKLNKKEFQRLARSLGEFLTKSELEEAVSQLDANYDGVIDMDEFIAFLQSQ